MHTCISFYHQRPDGMVEASNKILVTLISSHENNHHTEIRNTKNLLKLNQPFVMVAHSDNRVAYLSGVRKKTNTF